MRLLRLARGGLALLPKLPREHAIRGGKVRSATRHNDVHAFVTVSLHLHRLKRNRCANCFDCPSCGHTLTTRATSVHVPSAEDPTKVVPKKVYYLSCTFCRWTSRDIGLKDQTVASGGWPDMENPHSAR